MINLKFNQSFLGFCAALLGFAVPAFTGPCLAQPQTGAVEKTESQSGESNQSKPPQGQSGQPANQSKPSQGQSGQPANQPTASSALAPGQLEKLIKDRYLLYHQTLLKAGSFDDVLPFRSANSRKEMEKKSAEAQSKGAEAGKKMMEGLFALVKTMEPRNVRVDSVKVMGDKAELSVSALDGGQFSDAVTAGLGGIARGLTGASRGGSQPGQPMRSTTVGKINMFKEDGNWMVGDESWSTRVTNLTPAQEAKRAAEEAAKKGLSSWCAPAASMDFPKKPAAGSLNGQAFVVEGAEFNNGNLTLRQGRDFFADREVLIFLFGLEGNPDGQQIAVRDGEPVGGKGTCHVHMSYKVPGKDLPTTKMFMPSDGYGIRLAFGQRKNGLLPGYIVLRLPDKAQSYVQGYFYAKLK
ncbi:MAG: hypothetical protein HY986_20260 [Candidatus Melainabacteria bacterium]|nr:hypothetical protein [Candidatus Melainabacteria bacterium]